MSSLSYADAIDAIASRGRYGIRLGLGRTRALLAALGNPERRVRGALVGGTNGKGSVLALAGAALQASGVRTGLTPKPHLISYRERIEINGEPIQPGDFASLVEELLPIADRVARRHGPPTEFEFLTAAIFAWFARRDVEVAVVEVGLGGRLDATHAWDGGVAVITNVDLDHTAELGSTVEAIAREKAAIIEAGDLAVTGATGPALAVIRRRAARLAVPLAIVPPAPLLSLDRDGIDVHLPALGPTRVGLRGRHQAANVAVADALLDALEAAGIAVVPEAARRRGYAEASWPGRLELIEVTRGARRIEVLLDGAHNPSGAAALAAAIDDLRPFLSGGVARGASRLTLVLGTVADKDVAGIVRALSGPSLADAAVICTQPASSRALPAAELAANWQAIHGTAAKIEPEPAAAIARAIDGAEGPVVIAGSLYLVGEARGMLRPDPRLADPLPRADDPSIMQS